MQVIGQHSDRAFPFRNIEFLSDQRGLIGSETYWITQDQNGFIWLVTDHALSRYDGYEFRSFGYDAKDANSFTVGWYWGLHVDARGNLWIPSQETGIYSFDPLRLKYKNYRHREQDTTSLSSDRVWSLCVDQDGLIWALTDEGVDVLDPETQVFQQIPDRVFEESGLLVDHMLSVTTDEKRGHIIWFLDNDLRLSGFDTKARVIIYKYEIPLLSLCGQSFSFSDYTFSGMKNGNIWVGSSDEGIFGFDTRKGKPIYIPFIKTCRASFHKRFYHVMEDKDGNLWTANDENEIVYYVKAQNRFYYYSVHDRNIQFHELSPFFFQDRSQKIWVATNNGLITIDTKQKPIHTFKHSTHHHSISGDFVFDIFRISNGQLLVGTTDELDLFDPERQIFSRFPLFHHGKRVDAFSAWTIDEDDKGTVWIIGNFGLASFDPVTKQSKVHKLYNEQGPINMYGSCGFTQDRWGRYWMSIWGRGMHQFDPLSGKAKSFFMGSGPDSINTNSLGPIYCSRNGILYISGWESGLIAFDPETETFKVYKHNPEDLSSIRNETANVCIEKNGLLWLMTFGGGINVFNPVTEKFKAFTTEHGLAHNFVNSLVEDQNGDFWAGTRGGLSRFTPPANPFDPKCTIQFRNYDMSDGLPSTVLNHLSAYCDQDGTLYFGTRNAGLFSFHPDSLRDNAFIPPVFITELWVLNRLVSVKDSTGILEMPVEFTKEITLKYAQNIISLTFAALNFEQPEKNKYAYQLEGYDTDWIYTDASRRFASYTNLDAGDYTFKVKGSNNDGVWNDQPAILHITIIPPFWATAWFRILVIWLIGSGIYALYRFRLQQILKVQTIRNKIAHDLHDNIGSTLNSISIYSEVAQNKSKEPIPELALIGESSRKVIEAMSDIVWTINPENDSFEKIIYRMRSHLHSLMKARNIEYTFRVDDHLNTLTLPMQIRKNFYLIFKEAINNLLKYSQATRVAIVLGYVNNHIELSIRDNGVGFDVDNFPRGNGMNNMKRRAEDMKALFQIESVLGEGTSIELILKP